MKYHMRYDSLMLSKPFDIKIT